MYYAEKDTNLMMCIHESEQQNDESICYVSDDKEKVIIFCNTYNKMKEENKSYSGIAKTDLLDADLQLIAKRCADEKFCMDNYYFYSSHYYNVKRNGDLYDHFHSHNVNDVSGHPFKPDNIEGCIIVKVFKFKQINNKNEHEPCNTISFYLELETNELNPVHWQPTEHRIVNTISESVFVAGVATGLYEPINEYVHLFIITLIIFMVIGFCLYIKFGSTLIDTILTFIH